MFVTAQCVKGVDWKMGGESGAIVGGIEWMQVVWRLYGQSTIVNWQLPIAVHQFSA